MTLSEKKIELVQNLLLLQDFDVLFKIEKLLAKAFQKNKETPIAAETEEFTNFEDWVAQFDDPGEMEAQENSGMSITQFRQHIWAAEQGPDMNLEAFFERVDQRYPTKDRSKNTL